MLYRQHLTGRWVILGVVSFGYECATYGNPGYYARVNRVVPWIRTVLRNTTPCSHEVKTPDNLGEEQSENIIQKEYSSSSGSQISLSTVSHISSAIMVGYSTRFTLIYLILIPHKLLQEL